MRKAFIAVLVMLVVLAAPAGAYFYVQYNAQRTMENVRAAVEDIEGGKMFYGPVAASLFDGTMSMRDVVYVSADMSKRITIEESVLSGDSESAVVADLKTIAYAEQSSGDRVTLDRLNVVGIDLTPFDSKEELAPDNLGASVLKLKLDRLVATEFAANMNDEKLAVATFRSESVDEGVARYLSITDGAVTGTAPNGEAVDFRVKGLALEGLDFRSFRSEAMAGHPGMTVLNFLFGAKFESFNSEGLRANVDELKSSVAQIEIRNAVLGVVDRISIKAAAMDGKHRNKPLAVSIGDFMVDRLDLTAVQRLAAERDGPITGKEFLETLKVGEFLVDNAALGSDRGKIAVEKFHIRGLADGIVERLVVDGAGIGDVPDEEVREVRFKNFTIGNLDFKIDFENREELFARMQDYMGVTEGHISGIRVVGVDETEVSVARFGVADIVRDRGVVVSAKAFIESLELPLDAIAAKNPGAAQFLRAFNDKSFRFDALVSFDYDIAAGDLKEAFTLSAAGMGKLKLDLRVVGFDQEIYSKFVTGRIRPDEWLQQQDVKFAHLIVRYDDDRLADTVVDMFAGGNRPQFAAQMAQNVASAYPEPRFLKLAARAITDFLTGANRFHVVARPAAPVTVPDVIQAFQSGTLVPVLNLEILGN